MKRPKNIFCLDKETFINNSILKSYLFLHSDIDFFAQINALYHFATYLKTCGNITGEEQREFQEQMEQFYWKYYSKVRKSGPEMLLFEQFPLFNLK